MKDLFKKLTREQKNILILALESQIETVVEISPNLYIGVYIGGGYRIIETSGHFALCEKQGVQN